MLTAPLAPFPSSNSLSVHSRWFCLLVWIILRRFHGLCIIPSYSMCHACLPCIRPYTPATLPKYALVSCRRPFPPSLQD